ncbi:MAG: hypothetical protein ACLTPN_02755 [Clostridia bacterium]
MAIRTDEDLEKVFSDLISDVISSICQRAKRLLQEHINTDTYGINKTNTGMPTINSDYLDGSGKPSYEFRDKAWDTEIRKSLFSIFYNGDLMSPPSASSPYLHGNLEDGKDRRNILADLLNVSGIAPEGDFHTEKKREPFWDNFEQELQQKLSGWLYTEFNNRGLSIPDLKNAKFG